MQLDRTRGRIGKAGQCAGRVHEQRLRATVAARRHLPPALPDSPADVRVHPLGKQLGEFSTVHAIDCRNPDELVVVEIGGTVGDMAPPSTQALTLR